jgi:hemerythrin
LGLTETAGSPKYHFDIQAPAFFMSQPRHIVEVNMPTPEPDDVFRALIRTTDQQSMYLIAMLDKAYVDIARGKEIRSLTRLIGELVDYATAYLYYVENLSSLSADVMNHKKKYKMFERKVDELEKALYHGRRKISLGDLTFLINWLTHNRLGRYAYPSTKCTHDETSLERQINLFGRTLYGKMPAP